MVNINLFSQTILAPLRTVSINNNNYKHAIILVLEFWTVLMYEWWCALQPRYHSNLSAPRFITFLSASLCCRLHYFLETYIILFSGGLWYFPGGKQSLIWGMGEFPQFSREGDVPPIFQCRNVPHSPHMPSLKFFILIHLIQEFLEETVRVI